EALLLPRPREDLLRAARPVVLEHDDGLGPDRAGPGEVGRDLPDHVRAPATAAHVEDEPVAARERPLEGLLERGVHVGAHEVPEVDDAELLAVLLDDADGRPRPVEEALLRRREGDLLDLAAL